MEDRGEAPLHMAIRAEIAHVNAQQVLATLGREYEVAGRVDGQIDMTTSGRSLPQLVSSLAGKAAFTVREQASNTDLQVQVTTEPGNTYGWGNTADVPTPAPCRPGRARRAVPPGGTPWGMGQRTAAPSRAGTTPPGRNARQHERHFTQGPQLAGLTTQVPSRVRPRAAL